MQPADPLEYLSVHHLASIAWRIRLIQELLSSGSLTFSRYEYYSRRELQLMNLRLTVLRTLGTIRKTVSTRNPVAKPFVISNLAKKKNLKRTRVEPSSNLNGTWSEPASNLNDPDAA
jgi:hypothetical protein